MARSGMDRLDLIGTSRGGLDPEEIHGIKTAMVQTTPFPIEQRPEFDWNFTGWFRPRRNSWD